MYGWGEFDQKPKLDRSTVEYRETLKQNLNIANEVASKIQKKHKALMWASHNKRSKPKSFNMGDSVLILIPDSSNALLSRWIGPAIVEAKISANSYQVTCENGSVRNLHADKLRFFNNRIASVGVIFDDPQDSEFYNIISCLPEKNIEIMDCDDRERFNQID
jgi:hypothetical protein